MFITFWINDFSYKKGLNTPFVPTASDVDPALVINCCACVYPIILFYLGDNLTVVEGLDCDRSFICTEITFYPESSILLQILVIHITFWTIM